MKPARWVGVVFVAVAGIVAGPAGPAAPNGASSFIVTEVFQAGGCDASTCPGLDSGLFLIDPASGKRVKRLTREKLRGVYQSREPIWSPDRSWIAYGKGYGNALEIWVVNGAGDSHRLTNNDQLDEWPSWSPNSTQLVVERFTADGGDDSELFIVNLDGSGESALTDNDVGDLCPEWSPDGSLIVLWRFERADIFTIRPDGADATRVTSGPDTDRGPTWSPDSRWILFERVESESQEDALFVVRRDGRKLRQLTNYGEEFGSYSWSLDGSRIFFSTTDGDDYGRLWSIGADGTGRKAITDPIRNMRDIAWAPSGQRILFTTGEGVPDIWLARIDGSRIRRVTHTEWVGEVTPSWGPPFKNCGAF